MYLRAAHTETDQAVIEQFVRDNSLGLLTTALQSDKYPLIQVSHIPFVFDPPPESSDGAENDDAAAAPAPGSAGTLRGHLTRVNPQAKALIEAARSSSDGRSVSTEVLVLFNGVDAYVPPRFYRATKPTTGKVVPTWNYSAVQAYGHLTIFHDTSDDETGAFLSRQIEDLSAHQEANVRKLDSSHSGWSVEDAPSRYIELLKKAIVGVEIRLTRLQGKCKASQEMGEEDRAGVVEGFQRLGTDRTKQVAQLVSDQGLPRNATV